MRYAKTEQEVAAFCAELISRQVMLKRDCESLQNEEFRTLVEKQLAGVGMQLIDNIYSDYFAVSLKREYEQVIDDPKKTESASNNLGFNASTSALLSIVWALLILPKREKQSNEANRIPDQLNFVEKKRRPIPINSEIFLLEENFRLEFGHIFGKRNKQKFTESLNDLVRAGFLKRRTLKGNTELAETRLYEGPLLDTLIDYSEMVEHIRSGLLENLGSVIGSGDSLTIAEN
jgi:hypothetical protein